jgi:deoxycytidylate deaminase
MSIFLPGEYVNVCYWTNVNERSAIIAQGNNGRTRRVQQLVDSSVNMQADISHASKKLDEKIEAVHQLVNEILSAHKIDNVDVLEKKATAQFTPEEKKTFEQVSWLL